MPSTFTVLYTHQKTKKRKVWQDGTLTLSNDGRNADLRDAEKKILTSIYIRKQINPGDDLDSPRYLIQVEEICTDMNSKENEHKNAGAQESITATSSYTSVPMTQQVITDGPKKKKYKFTAPRRVGLIGNCMSLSNSSCANKELVDGKIGKNDMTMVKSGPGSQSIFTMVSDIVQCPTQGSMQAKSQNQPSTVSPQPKANCVTQKVGKKVRTTDEILQILNRAKKPQIKLRSKVVDNENGSEHAKDVAVSKDAIETPFKSPIIEQTIQDRLCRALFFPTPQEHKDIRTPQRSCEIPTRFDSVETYVKALVSVLHEHLNLILWQASEKYHTCMASADITTYANMCSWGYQSPGNVIPEIIKEMEKETASHPVPSCHHGTPAKSVMVNKEGRNKGRYFYACSLPRAKQCKFFKWHEDALGEFAPSAWTGVQTKAKLNNARAVTSYMKRNGIDCYCECVFVRKSKDVFVPCTKVKVPEWIRKAQGDFDDKNHGKKKFYIKLSRKERSSTYNKDDIWVISHSLSFAPDSTFIARSSYYGPSSTSELEIQPLSGYSSVKWNDGDIAYALLVHNAATELACIRNLQENLSFRKFPLLPHILDLEQACSSGLMLSGFQHRRHMPTIKSPTLPKLLDVNYDAALYLADKYVEKYQLNEDQASALCSLIDILCGNGKHDSPIMLVHGVFGSGKSFLLSVMVMFISELSEQAGGNPGKVLLTSNTNVAVDRVLLCLLDLGFTAFCRVGSIRKIASRVLPYSVHMTDNEHIKELQSMLGNPDLSHDQKHYIRKSLEQVRLGNTKTLLNNALLVGTTCAASTFACLQSFTFPLVILDECTQCTEPLSLLPLSNFGCRGLVLVGDPNQLPPTIEGAKALHDRGLEQTLFNRLSDMGHCPIMLRTQYRCHPAIGGVIGKLFYDGQLINGTKEDQRPRLVQNLPNLIFYDVSEGREDRTASGSFKNDQEALFISGLVKLLLIHGVPGTEIGIISLYKAQVGELVMSLHDIRLHDLSDVSSILVSTVDAFQGAEKSVIILSCVRTTHSSFADCDKRMCVALTRARNHLLIVGHRRCLSASTKWQQVIDACGKSVQTPFQFQKSWGKKLDLASTQEGCIAQPPPIHQYDHMASRRDSPSIKRCPLQVTTTKAELESRSCRRRPDSPLFDMDDDFMVSHEEADDISMKNHMNSANNVHACEQSGPNAEFMSSHEQAHELITNVLAHEQSGLYNESMSSHEQSCWLITDVHPREQLGPDTEFMSSHEQVHKLITQNHVNPADEKNVTNGDLHTARQYDLDGSGSMNSHGEVDDPMQNHMNSAQNEACEQNEENLKDCMSDTPWQHERDGEFICSREEIKNHMNPADKKDLTDWELHTAERSELDGEFMSSCEETVDLPAKNHMDSVENIPITVMNMEVHNPERTIVDATGVKIAASELFRITDESLDEAYSFGKYASVEN